MGEGDLPPSNGRPPPWRDGVGRRARPASAPARREHGEWLWRLSARPVRADVSHLEGRTPPTRRKEPRRPKTCEASLQPADQLQTPMDPGRQRQERERREAACPCPSNCDHRDNVVPAAWSIPIGRGSFEQRRATILSVQGEQRRREGLKLQLPRGADRLVPAPTTLIIFSREICILAFSGIGRTSSQYPANGGYWHATGEPTSFQASRYHRRLVCWPCRFRRGARAD
jgi:hypothetical protein